MNMIDDVNNQILSMKILKCIGWSLFLAAFTTAAFAQNVVLKQSNESGIYQKGEKVQVTLSLNAACTDSIAVKIRKNFSWQTTDVNYRYSGQPIVLYDQVVAEPTSLVFEVRVKGQFASIGLVAEPDKMASILASPKDIDDYWKNEKKALHALPMEVKSQVVTDIDKGYSWADVEINCTGPKPARGYYAKPLGAKPKSLPIVLQLHAAGVKGAWCLAQPQNAIEYATKGNGALCFDLNAHGMLNGQPQSYYDQLDSTELKNYFYSGIESRNDYYFRGMYLRLLRVLDFLTSQPEWDGKRILVIGESQGGGQALAAAALDSRVSAVVATVPALCGWDAALDGRIGGWPNPLSYSADKDKMLNTLPYFDVANLLHNTHATLVVEIGFIDITCPPPSIYEAINQAKGPKVVYGVPYRGHHVDQKEYQKQWEETVYQPKMKFIDDYLK
jgi:cephalosporin-C deacetylase-like acetyl esterase